MPNIVLVVDMVRGFCEEGGNLYTGESARRIVPVVRDLIERESRLGSKIIFLCDNHEPDDLEFEMFPEHCVRGTSETELIPELVHFEGDVIPKQRYSGFFNTDLDQRLRELDPREDHSVRGLYQRLRHAHGGRRPESGLPRRGARGCGGQLF